MRVELTAYIAASATPVTPAAMRVALTAYVAHEEESPRR
jgi:hypothetical protein